MLANPLYVLDGLLPDPGKTSFPVPQLLSSSGPAGSFTYESFTLGGVPLPGQWLLVDATRVFGFQIVKGWGLTGATLRPIGDDPMSFKFAIKIWSNADAMVYRKLLKTILRKPVFTVPGALVSAALGIDQVQVNDMGVSAVVVKAITPLMNPLVSSGGKGAWTAACELLEYRKPIPAPPTPSQATPNKSPPVPSAVDAADLETQRLAAAFNAKASSLAASLSGGPRP